MQSMHNTLLKLAQLRRTGHVTRMPDERLLKKVFYGDLLVGKLRVGKHSQGRWPEGNTIKTPKSLS